MFDQDKYEKEYDTPEKEAHRKAIWVTNYKAITANNNEAIREGETEETRTINEHTDLTEDELRRRFTEVVFG